MPAPGLLWGRPVPVDKQVAHATYASSPFLNKLPAEVRNRIYTMALGGHTIHASGYERESKTPRGKATTILVARTLSCRSCEDDVLNARLYEKMGSAAAENTLKDRHSSCALETLGSRPHTPLPPRCMVGFLTVCRQIYQEAALVPFMANTFSFRDSSDIITFCNAIEPWQKRAISSIVLARYLIGTREDAYQRLIARGLGRLKTFVVCRFFEVSVPVDIDSASDDDEESEAGGEGTTSPETAVEQKQRRHDKVVDDLGKGFKKQCLG